MQKFISNAKINLFLKVLNKRKDNFHNIFSLFHKLDLCDYIYISENDTIEVKSNVEICDVSDNIAYKAALALNEYTGRNNTVLIEIDKQIPIGAGLGGGSSNAATTLIALNQVWNLNLTQTELLEIAANLGSDVPFFIYDKPALISGRGDIIEPIDLKIEAYYLLIYPNIPINTAQAYAMLKRDKNYKDSQVNIDSLKEKCLQCESYSNENILLVDKLNLQLENDFEEGICQSNNELYKLKEILNMLSNGYAAMTGSGSSFFALFDTLQQANQAKTHFQNTDYKVFVGKLTN
ncbi:4-diphosphocytidyl-2-C-methyl-D-erythritol kinase [bioreactor metagenome]|uniref:4-(cytidine 5'-diphospho)-2-C-methyl-D-erythritol kinase n=1 Tax=bioreactor metagenome TaxID=1076179 RepID=A0A645DTM8_9ZZZZ